MIPRFKADFGALELWAALTPTGSDAKAITQFETRFAALFDQTHGIAMPYGRTGLILLLKAMGLENSEVLCPSYTCLVVPEAIDKSGNRTVFVDCVEDDYNVSFDLLEQAVSPNTGAFIATSIFGHPLNGDKLAAFRARYPHVKIIQDCAHSFGAEWEGQPVVPMGEAALFGLNISKIMSSVFGGMITTDDAALAARLRALREDMLTSPGWLKSLKRRLYLLAAMAAFTPLAYRLVNWLERARFLDRFTAYHDDERVFMPADYLEMMTGFEARIGTLQCGKYDAIIAHRRHLAHIYFDALSDSDGPDFRLPPDIAGATYSHFTIRTPLAPELIEGARQRGVQLGTLIEYYCPDNGAFRTHSCFGTRSNAAWPGQMINLPLQRAVTHAQARRIAADLKAQLQSLR